MVSIREIVQEALEMGYLSLQAEEQLRQMLASQYDLEDLSAFMLLQHAAMSGRVRQESRQWIAPNNKSHDNWQNGE